MLGGLLFALRTLTILPLPRRDGGLGPATLLFPLVGLLIGLVTAAVVTGLRGAPAPVPALVAVTLLAILGGGRSLRGLAHLGDGLVAFGDRRRALERIERERVGAVGLGLVVLALGAKLWALSPLPATWAVLFAPMLGRWAMVVIAFSSRQARVGPPGPRFEPGITFHEFGWASAITGALALASIDAVGLLAMLAVAAATVSLRLIAHRWLGGIDQPLFWASAEVGEIAALFVLGAVGVR